MSIGILLADDHKIVREGLRALLTRHPDMKVVAECGTGREAVRLALELKPDAVVMDVSMPDMDGIEAVAQIKAALPSVKVVGLSMHSDRHFVVRMLHAGASAYLLKESAFDDLARAIRLVVANDIYVSSGVLTTILDDFVRRVAPEEGKPLLTEREQEVLRLLADGHSTKAAAARLGISVQTVSAHRTHIMNKLGFQSTADLVKYAIAEGIVDL